MVWIFLEIHASLAEIALAFGEFGFKILRTLDLSAQMKFLIQIFFLHYLQPLNFDIKKDLAQSDCLKESGTLTNTLRLNPPLNHLFSETGTY